MRSLFGDMSEVFDRVGGCKRLLGEMKVLRRNVNKLPYLID